MRNVFARFSLIALMLCVAAGAASAEDKKIGNMTLDELTAAIKRNLGFSMYFQGGYTYNPTMPPDQLNTYRVFDQKANSFTLDLVQLIFAKDAAKSSIGYKVKLSAGETAKYIHSAGLGAPGPGETSSPFDLTEAYVSYLAPLGNGLKFSFGKWATYFGAEVIEAKDDANYSRSFLFNYAIPFTHTGVKADYAFSDAFTVGVHAVNGWDNSTDNNDGKSLGVSLGVTPSESVAMMFNAMRGPEQANNDNNVRTMLDWVGTIKPVKGLALILNYDYGAEENAIEPNPGQFENARWYGFAGIIKVDTSESTSIAVRGEVFKDPQGYRTGVAQSLKEVTFTPEFRLADGLIVRPEYRRDWSGAKVFRQGVEESDAKHQDTVSLSMMYSW